MTSEATAIARFAPDLAADGSIPEVLAALRASLGAEPPILAVGWATVELDRAASELAGVGLGPFAPAPPDHHLGAIARAAPALVLLEPSTEGRLAASLVRRDEGPCALYLAVGAGAWPSIEPWRLSAAANGPVGEQRLVERAPIWGPHILLVRLPSGG